MAELKHGMFITKFPSKCLLLAKVRALCFTIRYVGVELLFDCERASSEKGPKRSLQVWEAGSLEVETFRCVKILESCTSLEPITI